MRRETTKDTRYTKGMKVKGQFLLRAVGILLDLPLRVVRVFGGSIRSRPLAIVLAVVTPVVIILWHLLAVAARPPHLNQVVAELGSTTRFVANPIPNHACTRLVFLETTENGYGVFLCDGPGKRKLLFEQPSKAAGYVGLNESLLGWSPDDKLFAYCRRRSGWEIVFCDGSTGAEAGTAPVNGLVSAAAWVGSEALVLADDKRVLQTVRRHHDQWVQPQPFKYYSSMNAVKGFLKALNVQPAKQPAELPIKGLSPFGPDSVVWQQGGTLYACGANSNAPVKLWESPPGNTLLEFAAAEPQKLLLHCRDSNGEYLARFYPPNRITEVTRIKGNEVRPNHVMLVNDGEGYAYFTQTGAEPDRLIIKPDDAHPATEVPWQDQVRYFAAGRDAVYVVSSLNDEPPGIWRCEAASGFTECVVPNVEKRFRYARNSHIAVEAITNAAGEELTCYLLAPAHLTGGQKHPLVIGILGNQEMGFSWSANHEAIANCGAFFASVDRHQRGYSSWAEDAFTVYETLAQRPEIDRNKVLLYADSAGISAVYDLLEQHPKLWRGAILFSPTSFPDPSRIPGARLFLDNGGADGAFGKEGAEVPRRFQDSAVRAGIPVTLIIHPGLPHTVRMPMGERERMREALIFLGRG